MGRDRFLISDFSRARTCGINLEIAESRSFSRNRSERAERLRPGFCPPFLSFFIRFFLRTYRSRLSRSRVFTPRQSRSCFRSSHPLCERDKNRGLRPELLPRLSKTTPRARHTDLLN